MELLAAGVVSHDLKMMFDHILLLKDKTMEHRNIIQLISAGVK